MSQHDPDDDDVPSGRHHEHGDEDDVEEELLPPWQREVGHRKFRGVAGREWLCRHVHGTDHRKRRRVHNDAVCRQFAVMVPASKVSCHTTLKGASLLQKKNRLAIHFRNMSVPIHVTVVF